MSAGVSRWYPSKIDLWIGVLLAMGPLVCLVTLAALLASGETEGLAVGVGSTVFLFAIYLGLVFPMRYGIDDKHILVRHGLVTQRIPLRDITEVAPTRNPLSSPALSLERLNIKFGEGFFRSAMISPSEREPFLAELAAKAGLVREGDRLVRR
jgi:hypothetical protein